MQQTSLKALVQAKFQRNSQHNQDATTHATKAAAVQQVVQLSPIKDRDLVYREVELKLKYNELLKREKAGEIWMDSPERKDEEVSKRLPLFNEILAGLNKIIDDIGLKNCTVGERLNGFNVIPLLGGEVSLEELPQKWH